MRNFRWVLAVIAGQAALLGLYLWIEQQRTPVGVAGTHLSTAAPELVDAVMPPLALRTPDGSQTKLAVPARPTLVHFWATWCPPCRTELPGFLALPNEHPVQVLAVALDQDWADVARFLQDLPTSDVVLGDAREVERALGVRTLPVTLLVQPSGRVSHRFSGARDWADASFLRSWLNDAQTKH